jgi:hypothetical protein
MSAIVLKGSTAGTVTLQPAANVTPNVTFTLPALDGTSGQVLATNGSGVLSFITNDGTASFTTANSAASYANGAFIVANTSNQTANSASNYANGAFESSNTANLLAQAAFNKANTLFDSTAQANVNTLTANTITSVNVISSNTVTANNLTITGTLNVDGVNVLWHEPPTTSKGSAGDVAGLIAIDNDKLYRCVGTYDGTTDIWRFINFTGNAWG